MLVRIKTDFQRVKIEEEKKRREYRKARVVRRRDVYLNKLMFIFFGMRVVQ
jgi:hypothetical protein